jgi:hypothetical protein
MIRELFYEKKWKDRQTMKLMGTVFHIILSKGPNFMDCLISAAKLQSKFRKIKYKC